MTIDHSYILNIVLFIFQWRQEEFIDKRTPVFPVVEKIDGLFRVVLNARSNPIHFILFGGGPLKESAVSALYFTVIISCQGAESIRGK